MIIFEHFSKQLPYLFLLTLKADFKYQPFFIAFDNKIS